MAAIFVSTEKGSLFQTGFTSTPVVSVDTIDSAITSGSYAIYTDIQVQTSETVQYFLTFDDVIKYIHFGKGVGAVTVNGILFADCSETIAGLANFWKTAGSQRGKVVRVSMAGLSAKAVLTNIAVNVVGEPTTMAQFSLQLAMIDHNL